VVLERIPLKIAGTIDKDLLTVKHRSSQAQHKATKPALVEMIKSINGKSCLKEKATFFINNRQYGI